MARTDPQLNLRLPAALKDDLEAAAAKNNRTTTAETVERLRQSFDTTPDALLSVLTQSELRAAKAEFMVAAYIRISELLAFNAHSLISKLNEMPEKIPAIEVHLPALVAAIHAVKVMIGSDIYNRQKLQADSFSKYEELLKLEKQVEEIQARQVEEFGKKS